jgi:hypothetical protein
MSPAERPAAKTDLWFHDHPRWAFAVAVGLFAGVFALRLSVPGASEAVALFYVLPIALVAFAFGRAMGAAAGVFGFALFVVWAFTEGVTFSAVGWSARAVPMLLLGVLVGGAADQQRRAATAERELLVAQLHARRATELNDSIVQQLAVAKWAAEAGQHARSLDVLTETVESAQSAVSEMLNGRRSTRKRPRT